MCVCVCVCVCVYRCDNMRVQHGRLPFSPEAPKRVLLTVYSTPLDSF